MGEVKGPYNLTFASNASQTNSVLLGDCYAHLHIAVPSTSGAIGGNEKIYIESSHDDTTFYRHTSSEIISHILGADDLSIKSGLSNRIVSLMYQGGNYMRLSLSATVTASASCVFAVYGNKTN